MELTFPRCHRLKSHRAITTVNRRPITRHRGTGFRLTWTSDPTTDHPTRFAFVVSRRSGKAHIRNRIKRRLREAVRVNKSRWPRSASIVFTAAGNDLAYQDFGLLNSAVCQVFEGIMKHQNLHPEARQ